MQQQQQKPEKKGFCERLSGVARNICTADRVHDNDTVNRFLASFCCPFVLSFHFVWKLVLPCLNAGLWRFLRIFYMPFFNCCCGDPRDEEFPPEARSLAAEKDGQVYWAFGDFQKGDGSTAADVDKKVTWIRAKQYVDAMHKKKKDQEKIKVTCKETVCPPSRAKCVEYQDVKSPMLFSGKNGGIDAKDVCQGALGDCWLISAFACMAEFPGAIRRLFVTKEYNPRGWYCVKIYDARKKKWEKIWVDDYIPVYDEGNGNYRPIMASPDGGTELWVALLEKAFAKFCDGFTGMKGGHTMWAFEAMTGDHVFMLKYNYDKKIWMKQKMEYKTENLSKNPRNDVGWSRDEVEVDDIAAFNVIRQYDRNLAVIGCSFSNTGEAKKDNGIVAGHAYTVMQVVETFEGMVTKTVRTRLLQLRNPWGSFEWKGKWSDKDVETWEDPKNHREKKACGWTNNADADDGMFWIEWSDFKENFNKVQICDRTTWDDIQLNIDEELGCLGIATGCAGTACDFCCYGEGCTRIIFGRHSSEELVEVDKGCCCWKRETGKVYAQGKDAEAA